MFGVPRYLLSSCASRPTPWNKTSSVLSKVTGGLENNNSGGSKGNQIRQYHDVHGDILCPSQVMGFSHLRDPRLNKGLAFTLEERQTLGIHGLLPARYKTQDEQLALIRLSLSRYSEDINKYIYLQELQDRNEKLFYRLLTEDVETMLPIVYTPTVGLACQRFGLIYRRPRGLFINIHDKGHVFDVIKNWPEHDVKAICVTDGERILGLGDLGSYGMGIPVGKLALYTALAGIRPHQCLPILLDVGTNNQTLLDDPLYVGVRHKRVKGAEYDEFLDEFMDSVVRRYGQNCLIQFEDFANHNANRLLQKYRNRYCTFNDDIQGTASVVLAGLISACKITGRMIKDEKILFYGAGAAAIGIANLTVSAMIEEGLTEEQAKERIWMMDINGLLTKDRNDLDEIKMTFAKNVEHTMDLNKVINMMQPTSLLGACTQGGAFTPEVLKAMAASCDRPIIFALSNPTSKAECTPEQAYTHTEGRCVYSSGSPFPPVEYNGKTYITGQGNNAYIFPGVALGVLSSGINHIRDELFILASKTLSDLVSKNDLDSGSLFPPLSVIKDASIKIAVNVANYAYRKSRDVYKSGNVVSKEDEPIDFATVRPEPEDKEGFIRKQMYNYYYSDQMPVTWKWPDIPDKPAKPMEPVKKFIRDYG